MGNENFWKLRKKLQISQLELSVVAQVSPAMISAVEKYNYIPGVKVRTKLAGALGVKESMIWPEIETPEVAVSE
jgi:transcriptional regulator with XRE-family HTH domain